MLDKSIKNKKVLTLDVKPNDLHWFINSSVIDSSIIVKPVMDKGLSYHYECTIKVNDRIKAIINIVYNKINIWSRLFPNETDYEIKKQFNAMLVNDIMYYGGTKYGNR